LGLEQQALQNICLHFEEGKTAGIVGENEAGRTTKQSNSMDCFVVPYNDGE